EAGGRGYHRCPARSGQGEAVHLAALRGGCPRTRTVPRGATAAILAVDRIKPERSGAKGNRDATRAGQVLQRSAAPKLRAGSSRRQGGGSSRRQGGGSSRRQGGGSSRRQGGGLAEDID